jgi:DNA-binding FadR family transcriptional regulator
MWGADRMPCRCFQRRPAARLWASSHAGTCRRRGWGALGPGDRLSSERELAAQLGVSRNSLRPALAAVAAFGIVEIRHGPGACLRQTPMQADASSLAIALVEQNSHLPATTAVRMAVEQIDLAVTAAELRRDVITHR